MDLNQTLLAWHPVKPLRERKKVTERRKGSLRELVKGTCTVNSSKGSTPAAALHPPNLSLDESFSIQNKGRGILGMANKSHHRNNLQFHITFEPAPHMDKKHVTQVRKPHGKTKEAARASPGPKVTNQWLQSSVSVEGGPWQTGRHFTKSPGSTLPSQAEEHYFSKSILEVCSQQVNV